MRVFLLFLASSAHHHQQKSDSSPYFHQCRHQHRTMLFRLQQQPLANLTGADYD